MKEFKQSMWVKVFFPQSIIVEDKCIRIKNPKLFAGSEEVMAYEKITSIVVDFPMIGFSSIKFDLGYDQRICTGYYKDEVIEIRNTVHKLSEELKSKSHYTQTSNQNQHPSVADEITKLKGLLDSGVLTQEEFNQQKKKLLL